MNPLHQFFGDRIFCINVAARTDRWEHVQRLCDKFGFAVTRFEASTGVMADGKMNANAGCTLSHRRLLDLMVENQWPNMLVLEDDFDILHSDFLHKFEAIARELPPVWDMFYLGAHFGERPMYRHSPHLLRCGQVLTTSSYGITLPMAQVMREAIKGVGPIDTLYCDFHREHQCFVADPRLIVQYPNVSDLQGRHMDNSMSMLDKASAVPVN